VKRSAIFFLGVFSASAGCTRTPSGVADSADSAVSGVSHTRGATLAVELASTASVSVEQLRRHVVYLASDELEGRGASTAGLQKAALYLSKELAAAGVAPLFGDSYQQAFEMPVGTSFGASNSISGLVRGKDFEPLALSASGTVSASLVFAGFGITAGSGIAAVEQKYDDYFHLDVAKKIVVVLPGEPELGGGRRSAHHASLRAKVLRAREAKAAAVLIVREKLGSAGRVFDAEADAGIIVFAITEKAASKLLGFDVRAARRGIEASKKPASRAVAGVVSISAEILRERRLVGNVGGLLIPSSSTSTETVVIGAHYDHLGYGGSSSLSEGEKPAVHNGADDNASGSAAIVEIARSLAATPGGLRRRVAFLLFAGEESGLLGSSYFVKHAPFEVGSIVAMINLDMVGRLREDKINVMGVKTGVELEQLARRFVGAQGLVGSYGGDGYGPSDHTSFYAAGVPVLFLFTGAHADYHRPSDDAETLNYAGLARVSNVAADLIRALASAEDRVRYVAAPAPMIMGGGGGYGPYFGSIPDFGEAAGGVLLAGVRAGSPAERAGLRKGDLLMRFAGVEVKSLEDFTVALRGCGPGQVVEVEFVREGKKVAVKAKLEARQ
jgi:aminopeptidase YwaD